MSGESSEASVWQNGAKLGSSANVSSSSSSNPISQVAPLLSQLNVNANGDGPTPPPPPRSSMLSSDSLALAARSNSVYVNVAGPTGPEGSEHHEANSESCANSLDQSCFTNNDTIGRAGPNRAIPVPPPFLFSSVSRDKLTTPVRVHSRVANILELNAKCAASLDPPLARASKFYAHSKTWQQDDDNLFDLDGRHAQLFDLERCMRTYKLRFKNENNYHYEKKGKVWKCVVKVDVETYRLLYQSCDKNNRRETIEPRSARIIELHNLVEVRHHTVPKALELLSRVPAATEILFLYGERFMLKNWKLLLNSKDETSQLVKLVQTCRDKLALLPYDQLLEIWLRKQILAVDAKMADKLNLKIIKTFFHRNGFMWAQKRMHWFINDRDSIEWPAFFRTFNERILYDARIFEIALGDYITEPGNATMLHTQVGDHTPRYCFTLDQLIMFVHSQVHHKPCQSFNHAKMQTINLFQRGVTLTCEEMTRQRIENRMFTAVEVLNMLFAASNELWDSSGGQLREESMHMPLSSYWINSSHNTYLSGDQIYSNSSLECYIRALQMGCRSIEIDCWNGDNKQPQIYHGFTMTSKLNFDDVIQVIQDYAFVSSPYPLIISIEDHCNLEQQRYMAQMFKKTFGHALVTGACSKDLDNLPSPHQLQHRIILKHAKFDTPEPPAIPMQPEWIDPIEIDLSEYLKAGFLMMENPVTSRWSPYYLLLGKSYQLFYFVPDDKEVMSLQEAKNRAWGMMDDATPLLDDNLAKDEKASADEDESDDGSSFDSCVDRASIHVDEPWFYGDIDIHRDKVLQFARNSPSKVEGMFLVRKSASMGISFVISIYSPKLDKLANVMIREKILGDNNCLYWIEDSCKFDCIWDLVAHYRSHAFYKHQVAWKLTEPIYAMLEDHLNKPWFSGTCTKAQAQLALCHDPREGAFVLRPSQKVANTFTLSVFAFGLVSHCHVRRFGRLFTFYSDFKFSTLSELVEHYEHHPIMANGPKLLTSFSLELQSILEMYASPSTACHDDQGGYLDMQNTTKTMVATECYQGTRTNELSFPKHAIILNVQRIHAHWYRGDYGGHIGGWFPVTTAAEVKEEQLNQEIERKRTTNFISLAADTQAIGFEAANMFGLEIRDNNTAVARLASKSQAERDAWIKAIQSVVKMAKKSLSASLSSRSSEKEKGLAFLGALFSAKPFKLVRELSELFYYCQAVSDIPALAASRRSPVTEMVSIAESRIERCFPTREHSSHANAELRAVVAYTDSHLVRVYPKGTRIDSSNFNPLVMWASGVQMAALNYQKADMAMQLNHAMFALQNGNTGFVAKPAWMKACHNFSPFDCASLPPEVHSVQLVVTIIAGRFLNRAKCKSMVSPIVQVKILGCQFDCSEHETEQASDNGLNPFWNQTFRFKILCPELAFIRFLVVEKENVAGQVGKFLAQATYPVQCIRTGMRNVALRDAHSNKLEVSRLLVRVERR